MNIPAEGKNAQKAKFFREIAVAFEFLALFNSLEKEQQETLLEQLTIFQARTAK